MIFRPKVGAMWDPSVLWHNGTYYAFMIYEKYDRIPSNGLGTGHCLLATSTDGVHWTEVGSVLPPILAWWRNFAARYVTALCATPEGGEIDVAVPAEAEFNAMLDKSIQSIFEASNT